MGEQTNIDQPKRRAKKFTIEEQLQICKWLGEKRSYSQVEELVDEHFGKTIDRSTLSKSYMHNEQMRTVIDKHWEEYKGNLDLIPIANEIVRLRELQHSFDQTKPTDIDKRVKLIEEARAETKTDSRSPLVHNQVNVYGSTGDGDGRDGRQALAENLRLLREYDTAPVKDDLSAILSQGGRRKPETN